MADMDHVFLNAFINESSTVTEKAGADIALPAHKAVMYDANGDAVLATDGEKAFGVILSDTIDPIKQGERLDILIKNIGLLEAAGAIDKGDPVTINATGQGVKANAGDFIFGWAYTSVANAGGGPSAGEAVQVQINKSGKI